MKRNFLIVLILLVSLNVSGCGKNPQPPVQSTAPAPNTSPVTESTMPTTQSPEEATELSTAPVHSDFYIPGLETEEVIRYFSEVCLDAEFIHSGNPSVLQKWNVPIAYILYGEYTQEDLSVLDGFTDWLNTIEGFPGIYETSDPTEANLSIHFCLQEEMVSLMGDQFWGMDGAVTFWYLNDAIYDAIICYRTDLDQTLRNSVILEEIYNGLGPIQDTALRPDSIIYSEFSQPQALSEIDKLILFLHHSLQKIY